MGSRWHKGDLYLLRRLNGDSADLRLDRFRGKNYGIPSEQLVAQYKAFDILKTSPTLKQVGETAAFLASETGVAFNSHIVDVDCGKLNIL